MLRPGCMSSSKENVTAAWLGIRWSRSWSEPLETLLESLWFAWWRRASGGNLHRNISGWWQRFFFQPTTGVHPAKPNCTWSNHSSCPYLPTQEQFTLLVKKTQLRSLYKILQVQWVCSKKLCPKQLVFDQWYEERSYYYPIPPWQQFLEPWGIFHHAVSVRLVDMYRKVPAKRCQRGNHPVLS